MTGLLHRLAARATGTAWTVRSDARLPYGAGRLLEAGAGDDPVAEAPGAETSPAFAVREPWETPAAPHGQPTVTSARPANPQAMPGRLSTMPASTNDRTPDPPMPRADPASHARAAHAFDATGESPNGPVSELDSASPSLSSRSEPRPVRVAASETFPGSAQPVQSRNDPAPLLPPSCATAGPPGSQVQRQPTPAVDRWGGPSRQMARQDTSDTEVHIHIGRIDVTAMHESSKPKARARTQPVSLDAYLSARARGSK